MLKVVLLKWLLERPSALESVLAYITGNAGKLLPLWGTDESGNSPKFEGAFELFY